MNCDQEEKVGSHPVHGDIPLLFDGMNTKMVDYGHSFRADHDELVKNKVILKPLKSSKFGLPPCSMTIGQASDSGI